MELLEIENFAGLRDVRIEFRPITVLIGPQATGKSIISKLLFFFRELVARLPESYMEERLSAATRRRSIHRFKRYFPSDSWGTEKATISYSVGDLSITVRIGAFVSDEESRDVKLSWNGTLQQLFTKHSAAIAGMSRSPDVLAEDDDDAFDRMHGLILELMWKGLGEQSVVRPQFIPAGRSFFSQVQASIFQVLEEEASLDPFLVSFGALLENVRRLLRRRGFYGAPSLPVPLHKAEWVSTQIPKMRKAVSSILNASIESEKRTDTLRYADGRRARLANASSGQQEVAPLLLLLSRFAIQPAQSQLGLHIEEPEAHLFPSTQRELIQLMVEVFGFQQKKMSLLITTHSPYILTAFNNLVQAGLRYADATPKLKNKIAEIVPIGQMIPPGDLIAYLVADGKVKSIMDEETQLIDASVIDQVSNELAIQFDQLLWEE